MHKNFRCYLGWREKPLGTGEAAIIIVPLEEDKLTNKQLDKLLKTLRVTTFSEETIDFRIQELDIKRNKEEKREVESLTLF